MLRLGRCHNHPGPPESYITACATYNLRGEMELVGIVKPIHGYECEVVMVDELRYASYAGQTRTPQKSVALSYNVALCPCVT
jgi:hypothetical protein